jgi:hypothetical protein
MGLLAGVLLIGLIDPAWSKQGPSSLAALLRESEVVIQGRVESARLEERGQSGKATVRVVKVYRGAYENSTIVIRWSEASEDQRVPLVGEDRLLFLRRRSDGSYTGTQFGRSYWPLEMDDESGKLYTSYLSPIDLIEIDIDGLLKEVAIHVPGGYCGNKTIKVSAIFLEDIMRVLSDPIN